MVAYSVVWTARGTVRLMASATCTYHVDWIGGVSINQLELGGRGAGTSEDGLAVPQNIDRLRVKEGGAARVAHLANG